MSEQTPAYNHVIAVDVGKQTLELATHPTSIRHTLANRRGVIKRFLRAEQAREGRSLGQKQDLGAMIIVCEATGGYEQTLLDCALEIGINCHRAEGRRVRLFALAHGLRAKTDPLDAGILLKFARQTDCSRLYRPASKAHKTLAALVKRREELMQIQLAEQNRMEHASGDVQKSIRALLAMIKRQMKTIDLKMAETIKACPDLARKNQLLQSVTGVGVKTARTLLATMPELGTLSKAQAASLTGLAPYNRDSGKAQYRRRIVAGRFAARRCLFMAATVAIAKNPVMKAKFNDLSARGKPYKVAIVAIMRKLIVILNAILKENRPWNHAEITRQT